MSAEDALDESEIHRSDTVYWRQRKKHSEHEGRRLR